MMKRIANKAGITKPLTPHVLRHTFSILWIHKGGSTRALQGILGHDHLATTEIYLTCRPNTFCKNFSQSGERQKLYDRTKDEVTLDKIERIAI